MNIFQKCLNLSKKYELRFGHFSAFFELRTVFGPFLGTVVKNAKHKNVASGNSLNFQKKIASIFLIAMFLKSGGITEK